MGIFYFHVATSSQTMKSPPAVYLGYLLSVESPCGCRGWRHISCEGVSVTQIYNDSLFILKIALWEEKQKHPILYKTECFFI